MKNSTAEEVIDLTDVDDEEVVFVASLSPSEVSENEKKECVATILEMGINDHSKLTVLSDMACEVSKSTIMRVREQEEIMYELELERIWDLEESRRELMDKDFHL